ncbi:MAG: outer membrane beta-barrel protein [Chitinophagaceae bacterium]
MRHFLLFLFLFTTSLGNAQTIFSPDDTHLFYGGLEAGANFSQIDGDGFSGYHKVGFVGEGIVYIKPTKLIGFSLGLGYAQKGMNEADLTGTALGPAVFRYRVHLQYVEVPLLLQIFIPGRFHYSAGLAYNRLLSSNEESEDINPIAISPDLYPFEKQELSGIVSINYKVYGSLFLCGQYEYSITSIRNGANIPPGYATGIGHEYNNLMSFRLLYLIGSGNSH